MVAKEPSLDLNKNISDIWAAYTGATEEEKKALKYGPGGLESIYTFPVETDIQTLFKTFSSGVHRVLLTYESEGKSRILQNLSQYDVLRFLFFEKLLNETYLQKTLEELEVIKRPVICENIHSTLKEVINNMVKNNVSAVILEESKDKAITTFSASDLKYIQEDTLKQLDKIEVGHYLKNIRHRVKSLITVTQSTTLEETLKRLILSHVHRLWEVDENKIPTGVISLTDIFKFLAEEGVA